MVYCTIILYNRANFKGYLHRIYRRLTSMFFRFSMTRFMISCTSPEDRVLSEEENSKRMVMLWNRSVS